MEHTDARGPKYKRKALQGAAIHSYC